VAFTYWSSIDSDISLAEWDERRLHLDVSCLKDDSRCVLAGKDSKHSGRKKICFECSKMNRSEACLGEGAYDNNEWWLVKIGRWMEYACRVKSETHKLDSVEPLRCTWTLFLSEEMLGCILRVSQDYVSRVWGYDTSTHYRLDSISIAGWLEIFGAGSVSGESRSWQRFSCAIDWQSVNMVDSLNIPNSFGTEDSIRCTSNRHASNNLNHTWRFRHTWKHGSHSQISLSQFHMDNMQWKCAASTDSH